MGSSFMIGDLEPIEWGDSSGEAKLETLEIEDRFAFPEEGPGECGGDCPGEK